MERSRLARFVPWRGQATGRCSFCSQPKRPLAEGPAGVLLCRDCAATCVALLDDEQQKREAPAAVTDGAP